MRCPVCGQKHAEPWDRLQEVLPPPSDEDPSPARCPKCGGRLVDDHRALPVTS